MYSTCVHDGARCAMKNEGEPPSMDRSITVWPAGRVHGSAQLHERSGQAHAQHSTGTVVGVRCLWVRWWAPPRRGLLCVLPSPIPCIDPARQRQRLRLFSPCRRHNHCPVRCRCRCRCRCRSKPFAAPGPPGGPDWPRQLTLVSCPGNLRGTVEVVVPLLPRVRRRHQKLIALAWFWIREKGLQAQTNRAGP